MDSSGGNYLTGVGLTGIGNKELPYFTAGTKFRRLGDGIAAASTDDISTSGYYPTPSTALIGSALVRTTSDKEAV